MWQNDKVIFLFPQNPFIREKVGVTCIKSPLFPVRLIRIVLFIADCVINVSLFECLVRKLFLKNVFSTLWDI